MNLLENLKNNPVRIYALAVACLQLLQHYVADFPMLLVLAIIAVVLGLGETVRANVTPTRTLVDFDPADR